jgi:micrococcal nuclease
MLPEDEKTVLAMSRRRKTGLIALCLLSFLLFARLDNNLALRRQHSKTVSGERTNLSDHANYHGKKFIVENIIDGDTFDIRAPDGRRKYTRIRLLGIDTPETGGKESVAMHFASEAAAFTRQATLGKTVTVYLDRPGPTRGKYGRLLAYIKLPHGRFLNEVLLREGCACADYRFRHSFYNKYRQLEAGAQSSKKGLWENPILDQLPPGHL